MNTRDELIKRIIEIEDENILQSLLNIIIHWPIINNKFEVLTPAMQTFIEQGLDDVKNGKMHSQEEVEKMVSDWFKEK